MLVKRRDISIPGLQRVWESHLVSRDRYQLLSAVPLGNTHKKSGHVFRESDFRIVGKARNKYDLGILEGLVITNTRPKLDNEFIRNGGFPGCILTAILI